MQTTRIVIRKVTTETGDTVMLDEHDSVSTVELLGILELAKHAVLQTLGEGH